MTVHSVDSEPQPVTLAGLLRSRPEERPAVLAALAADERAALLEELIAGSAAAVLGMDRNAVDPGRPLTAFGLDSLSAVELQGAVEAVAGAPPPLADLLTGASVRDLARGVAVKLAGAAVERAARDGGRDHEDAAAGEMLREVGEPAVETAAPLSAGQRALWFLERLAPGAGAYNVVVAGRARGLDVARLGPALELLAARHPALRTVFPTIADEPVQRVLPPGGGHVDFAREDATGWSEARLGERLAEDAWRPFDLARGPLLRVRLFARESEEGGDQVLLVAVHHIVADFWSLAVLARELGALIGDEGEDGEIAALYPPRTSSFIDFARRQERRLAGPEGERLWSFWHQELAGERGPVPDLDLPTDRPRPPVATWRGLSRGSELSADLVSALRRLGSSEGATLFAALAAAWQLQLGRYAGQDDFAVGTPTSGRGAPEWAGVVGYFVNPVALRAALAGDPTFRELLARTRRTVLAALAHAGMPAPLLVERLRPVRDPARPPLFQVLLTLEQRRPGDDPGLAAFALGEEGARIRLGGTELESVALAERRAQFELSLSAAELPAGGLGLSLEANADLFDAATPARMLGHFGALLESAVVHPDRPLSELPLLTAAERVQLAAEWSATAAPSGPTPALPLYGLVAARALRTPDAVALVAEAAEAAAGGAGEVHLTYSELVARADALAGRLRLAGVGGPAPGALATAGENTSIGDNGARPPRGAIPLDAVERPVALLVERSADLVIGALGILAAGGVYLPVDPDHAEARLHLLLEDSRAAALVTQKKLATRLPEMGVPVLFADGTVLPRDGAGEPGEGGATQAHPAARRETQWSAGQERGSGSSPPPRWGSAARSRPAPARVLPEQLAYLIYTSGSTGRPKGVAVTHAAAVEHCLTWARAYRMSERDRVLQFPSAGFDAAVEQVFSALLSGATLVLRGPAPWGPRELGRRIAELDVTVADVTTAFFARWVEDAADLGPPSPSLRLIGISGEELRAETARRLGRTPLARVPVLNCYGPTETVVSATLHEVDPQEAEQAPVPIGRALAGRVARVLARAPGGAGQPQPVGIPGELCLGGVLARGYLGRPDWTAEQFIPDPWSASGARQTGSDGAPGARLYRTGDLVRRRPDGLLEFLGRIDDQVKVRGFRVEPGEIEAALAAHPAVREAAVLALPGGGEDGGPGAGLRLVAFVVAAALDGEDLRAFLAPRLPDYMIPAAWLTLPALPLNASGKVDRAALARRAAEARAWGGGGETSAAPRTPAEELLAGLWAALLGRERVGVHDDFFSLGGHSLLATRLVAQVSRLFGVDLPVSAVFAAPTVAGLAGRIAAASRGEAAPPVRRLPRTDGAGGISPPLPLSFAQRRLWFLDRLEPGTAAYNVPGAVRLAGPLDVPALAAALAEIVRRHEVLRTVYPQVDGEPAQRIEAAPAAPAALPVVDLSGLAREARDARDAEVVRRSRAEFLRPFDLERGPVLRTVLLRLGPLEHLLAATFHHVAVDDWSLGLFLDELAALYPALAARQAHTLPPLPVQYADFAAWQAAWIAGDTLARQLAYWRERLAGLPVLELPVDRPRPAMRDARGATRALFLPEEAAAAAARLARRQGATLFMVMLAAFQALLARVTGAEVVPVGSPVANRRRPEVERLIGLFVNTLVLDARVGDDPSLAVLVARVRQACLGAYAHQDLPFERLVEELQPSRDLGQNPLFQVMLVLEEPLPPQRAGALAIEPVRGESGTAKLDLLLAVSPRPEGGWDLLAEYAVALWDAASVERLLGWFRTLLDGAVAADSTAVRLSELPLLSSPERHQVLSEWNDTTVDFPAGARLHELVAAQAARTPDAVAVAAEGERLTYGGLMARAGQIADFLRSLPGDGKPLAAGVSLTSTRAAAAAPANSAVDSAIAARPAEPPLAGPEPRVGLCLARRPDLIAAILGILEAGAAYVPLDPAYPQERLELMLADAGAGVLLTESALAGRFAFFAGRTVLLDRAELDGRPASLRAVGPEGGERALAYVIYTSGSTGRPKPVGIEHRSAVTLVRWALGFFPAADLDGVLAATSVCFDLSIFEIFVPLAAGGCVVLAPNITGLPELADVSAVTLANAVPSPMAELVGAPLPAGLSTVNLAGEALKPELAARIYTHRQVERVVNLYGPSEDTTYSTVAVVPRGAAVVSIGRPLANTEARVVGRHGEPLPAGVPGELVLGGAGLARGYLGRPDLTAERFVPDPFGPDGARLYSTGDRARLLADGQIEFLGRLDQQVKLHGIRMELGEIENYLEQHPAVRQAVVALRSDGAEGPRLVGYVVPMPDAAAAGKNLPVALAAYLRERLPAIMVPAAWVVLAELPLTPNGKVDRRALPAPARAESAEPVAPRDAVEEKLAAIWSEVLGRERVGIHDDFFDLGGHSLLAVRTIFRIREAFGIELPVAAMFQAPTVAALARSLEAARDLARDPTLAGSPSSLEIPRRGPMAPASDPAGAGVSGHLADPALAAGDRAPLSSAQRRFWFLDRLEPGGVLYNLQVALRLTGPLDEAALVRALAEILRRHEPLRTVYADVDGEPFQEVLPPPAAPPLSRLSHAGLPASRRAAALAAVLDARIEQPFDLRQGPVARFLLVRCEEADHVLAAAFHHIATDGWSLGLFARELAELYAAFACDCRGPSPLPDLPLRYRDVAAAERLALAGPDFSAQLGFWRRRLAGLPPLALPVDRPRSLSPSHRAIARRLDLPAGLAVALLAMGRGEGITPFMVLAGGFAALLARLAGQEDFAVGAPVAGRIRPEAQGMIGLFVNTLVLRMPLAGDPAFLDLLRRVRDVAVEAQAHQEVPFDRLVEELQPERRLGLAPLFQALVTHLNDPLPPLHMPGLEATLLDLEPRAAELDLTLLMHQWEGSLRGWLSFRSDLFDPATASRLTGQLSTLLAGAAADPARRLWDLPLLSAAERRQVGEWSEPVAAVASREGSVHGLFEARARLAPDAPAILAAGETVSFAGLEARANRLAHHLIALGVGPEAPVGVLLERTPELPVALLAAMKAGGAYLPLDPGYPAERMREVLADAGAAVLVSRGELAARLPLDWSTGRASALVLLDCDAEAIAAESAASPEVAVAPAALAYVIYTSGSTGRPKGVGVPHGAAVAHLEAAGRRYGLGPGDRTLLFASPGFDASVEQVLVTLTSGAALAVQGAERWSTRELTRRIGEIGLTSVNVTTAYWHRWAGDPGEVESALPLRLVLVGGEEALATGVRQWASSPLAAVPLLNVYGPTEAVISAVLHAVAPEDGEAPTVPIGRPLPGRSAWVLDRAGNPQPPGVPGEICLGGPLARGYLGRPDLTAERFVPAQGGDAPGARLYRSGDRGRYRIDGSLEFLGRIDEQVKVRGFRVEPGEVEAVLSRHPLVRESAVLAVAGPGGDRMLAAWLVPAEEGRAADLPDLLRAALRESLPDYMVPAAWVTLPALPLTPHGKLDRGALPPPGPPQAREEEMAGAAPADPEVELLAGLFAELLGRERVRARDGFFDLGGHSLLATQLVSRVRAVFGVELPLSAVFEEPTPAGLAGRIAAARRAVTDGAGAPPPLVREPDAPAPLSFSQQRLWFLHQLEPDDAYHVPGALALRGPLDEGVLARALAEIVRRHEALRTVFREEGEGSAPGQVVLPPAGLPLPVVDLSALDPGARPAEAARLLEREVGRPFDLAAGPLVRVLLVRLRDNERLLSVVMHHIASDAWSLGIVLRELGTLYAAFAAGNPSPLPELPLQFPDFARWQRRWLAGEVLERELAHWHEALAGAPESLELPYDRPAAPGAGNRGGRVPFDLPADLYGGLTALARREGWTAFMALLAGFGALLSRYGGQEDLVVGSPIANRGRLELEDLIGFFTNTLPLRLDLAGDPAFRALGRRVRATALDAYAHQDLPFEKLVEELAPDRHLGRNPLFQAMLVLQHAPVPPVLPGVEAELVEIATATAKFDLTLMLVEDGNGASGFLEHALDFLEEATVERLLVHFRTLLAGAVANPSARLSELPLLTPAERAELVAWGRPLVPAPPPLLIHERVAAQAARTPEATAVVFSTAAGAACPGELSYRELLGRARALARRLRALGVGPDVPVGLYLPRSLDAMVAVLGILEAGGAYLPIDPDYPAERVRLMLDDAAAPVVLTHAGLAAALPAGTADVLALDELDDLHRDQGPGDLGGAPITGDQDGSRKAPAWKAGAPDARQVAGAAGTAPDHLAYVTYTSGSTGRPKGVAMTHAAISAMVDWQLRTSRSGGGRTLQFTSLSFDVSFQEIFGTWCAGGALVLVSEDVRRDPPALCRLLAAERVERLFLPFVALQQVAVAAIAAPDVVSEDTAPAAAGASAPGAFPACLREVMSAGEQLHVTPQVAELFARLPGSALHNHYGPSETHAVTWLALEGEPARWPERPPIGRPLDHARVFLLDRHLRQVPPGLPGEIWVGGAGLARGYLGRPDLTAERFLPDPFDELPGWRPGSRMYRTGDLARVPPGLDRGSDAEFLGRADFQVKVRGHRIELPEVEAALARHPAVLQAAVAARGETAGARRLAAYVVLREGIPAPTPGELRAFLAETLPDPMVPAAWARLDRLPLTSSGKLDRRALARLHPEEHWGAGDGFVAPRDPAEEMLAVIWREVLGIERVGAHDDFFALGGHSLLATQITSRIRVTFGVELPLRRVFEASTLAGLAAEVTAAMAQAQAGGHEGPAAAAPPIGREPRRPGESVDLPLSFAQERLWFLARLQPESAAYNIPLVLDAEGYLDPARLAAALARLAERHEALRTVFVARGGAPVQVVLPAAAGPFSLPVVALGALPPEVADAEAKRLAAADAARPFDLERGPLLRTLLLDLARGGGPPRWVLLLAMHHIVADGWSMGVLVREMRALYAGASLPELPVQYADFAVWQRRWLAGETLARQLAWWRERLAGAPAGLELPADRVRPPVPSQRGSERRFALDAGLVAGVTRLAAREGATPFMVLAAGLFALLGRLSGERDISLGSPIANRNHVETEGLIGFFVNSLVLRVDLGRAASFVELVRQVREASLGAYAHQDVPFEKLVDELQPERDLSRSPLFQVALALQNAPLPEAWLDGVRLTAEEPPVEVSKFDLSWALAEQDGRLAGVLQYATDLFDGATAARFVRGFATLLADLAARPQDRFAEASLLVEQERHQVLREWNDVAGAAARERTIERLLHGVAAAMRAEGASGPGLAAGARCLVLDEDLLPCPMGVVGDLYVYAGVRATAMGNNGGPQPGAGRLVPDPFAEEAGASLLATGERARWRADGSLELLGRAEHQIRVRGVRIEPGVVEAALARHPGVRHAVVTLREDVPGEERLVGYVVPGRGDDRPAPSGEELREHLQQLLPELMVPQVFVELAELPATPRGELDRAALPAPRDAAPVAYVAPRNDLERTIAAVWREVLGVERIGVHESFFTAGGTSLKIAILSARLQRALGREIPVVDLFRHPTIEGLARSLGAGSPASGQQAERQVELQAEAARARTETRRESLRQVERRARRVQAGRRGGAQEDGQEGETYDE